VQTYASKVESQFHTNLTMYKSLPGNAVPSWNYKNKTYPANSEPKTTVLLTTEPNFKKIHSTHP